MQIHDMTLRHYRNYNSESISFCSGTNIIYGNNAQGKTNILEAVSMFSHGRSYRAKSDRELVMFEKDVADIALNFSDEHREHKGEFRIYRDGKKTVKVNNIAMTKLSMLMSYLNVVMFTPADLELVKGSPGMRRRFLDTAISQIYPNYLNSLIQYNKALMQKNSLLRTLKMSSSRKDATLSVWNEQIAELGSKIMEYRMRFLNEITVWAVGIYKDISKEILEITYTPSVGCGIIEGEANADNLFAYLEEHQMREIDNGSALMGIQRDDFSVTIGGRNAKMYGSQGQQRSSVLALKMAQTEYIAEKKGEYPVLLLDDVMSELDISRRTYLSERIQNKQTLITCTDTDVVKNSDNTKLFYIENGTIKES